MIQLSKQGMAKNSALSAMLSLVSGAVTVELLRWAHRALLLNRFRFVQPVAIEDMILHAPLEFAWLRYSWFIGALILALPVAVAKRSTMMIVVLELLGLAFGFLHVLWDVGTPPGKFDTRLLHPGSVAVVVAQLCAAATLASLVLAIRCYRYERDIANLH